MASLVLDYLKVLLSTAPVTGIVAIVFMALFRDSLRKLIGRTKAVKFPGGEWSTSQVERTAEAEATIGQQPPEPVATQTDTQIAPPGLTLSPEDQNQLADFLKAEKARAFYWEYRYLNLYLVPHTQRVLDWLAWLQNRPTLQLYDALWSAIIANPEERRAILAALMDHHLVQARGNLLEVTPKGREYLAFRGPLPAPGTEGTDAATPATP